MRDLGSRSNDFALRAVSELREHGWLDEGLSKADLSVARYNNATQWPEGFDPAAAGAINVDEENED